MRKTYVALLVGTIVVVCAIYGLFSNYKLLTNKNESKEILENAYKLIASNDETGVEDNVEKNEVVLDDDIIGILVIPKLNVTAPIKDGTSQEVMRTSIGHFTESDYWNGNVSLASHNGGTNAHFFEKLNSLETNDEIEYKTKLGSKKYRIQKIYKISSYDWTSVLSNKNNNIENTITLITCINGQPNYRLCVRGIEI